MKRYTIAVIPGDGIGREVMPEALEILKAVSARYGFGLEFRHFYWSCEDYRRSGQMMPSDGLARLRDHDAILLGAVGAPGVPDHVSLWGLLLPIRREFEQYVNLRPVRLLPGVPSHIVGRDGADINYWIVRENCEGEYSQIGQRIHRDSPLEAVEQVSIFTRRGVDRIMRYAFDLAQRLKRPHVTSATKSNGLFHSMPYWDERFSEVSRDYADVRTDQYHIDILSARLVMSPERFDVIVASNLFGDILSDLGAASAGTIAMAPSANLNPERRWPSMFEPVHGSAPDIAGQNIANPIGQIWSAAMMLEHLGQEEAAAAVMLAIEGASADVRGARTPDLGGTAGTSDVGRAIRERIVRGSISEADGFDRALSAG